MRERERGLGEKKGRAFASFVGRPVVERPEETGLGGRSFR